MDRYTFVVQIYPGGISTLENLASHERIRISDLATVGAQIERWLSPPADGQKTDEPEAPEA